MLCPGLYIYIRLHVHTLMKRSIKKTKKTKKDKKDKKKRKRKKENNR